MKKKLDFIYKNQDGEYFKSVDRDGEILLSNPSYPFLFSFEANESLEEIGSAKEFEHLVKKEDYQFHEGDSITVKVDEAGDLKVIDEK